MAERERHSGRMVWLRLVTPCGVAWKRVAGGRVPRGAGPVSRMVPQFAADWRGSEGEGAVPRRSDAWLDARRTGAADVEIARQRGATQRNLREVGRGPAAVVGGLAGISG